MGSSSPISIFVTFFLLATFMGGITLVLLWQFSPAWYLRSRRCLSCRAWDSDSAGLVKAWGTCISKFLRWLILRQVVVLRVTLVWSNRSNFYVYFPAEKGKFWPFLSRMPITRLKRIMEKHMRVFMTQFSWPLQNKKLTHNPNNQWTQITRFFSVLTYNEIHYKMKHSKILSCFLSHQWLN